MKLGWLAIATLLFNTSVFATGAFEGTFNCEGHDPYINDDYTGIMKISQQNSVYKMEMTYDTGEKLRGTGGQYNEQLLSVVFQDVKNPKKVGLEQYQWSQDKKTMGGYWVYLGKDKLGKEICKKVN